jgi:hypothetical protein
MNDPSANTTHEKQEFLYRKGHIAILGVIGDSQRVSFLAGLPRHGPQCIPKKNEHLAKLKIRRAFKLETRPLLPASRPVSAVRPDALLVCPILRLGHRERWFCEARGVSAGGALRSGWERWLRGRQMPVFQNCAILNRRPLGTVGNLLFRNGRILNAFPSAFACVVCSLSGVVTILGDGVRVARRRENCVKWVITNVLLVVLLFGPIEFN